jgi:predicted nuclease of predicted toxin-antitoxin system
MSLKFFFDECVDEDGAAALRAHRVEVITTTDMPRKEISDKEQLAFAYAEGRVIYTIDHDFLRLAYECLEQNRPFAGIVYRRPGQRSKQEIIEALLLMHAVYDTHDMENHLEFI